MNILLYSYCFYPSVGGIETVSMTLAEGFAQHDITCKIITKSANNKPDDFPFEIIRQPSLKEQIKLIKWADVVLFNGANLGLQPWVILLRKPFIWVHAGYHVSCIDGLGWVNGKLAPIRPFQSIIYHMRVNGIAPGIIGGIKLFVRRSIAKYFVTKNIAITKWMNATQPLPRQVHIYNPFPLDKFLTQKNNAFEYDFLFLGRVVTEKGISTLIKAFAEVLRSTGKPYKLLIIGDGNNMHEMKKLAIDYKISNSIHFAGKKSGEELIDFISKGRIAVIPSESYEPMGGVCLELMAAGKNLIVAESGGLKECVEEAGLSFANGDSNALAMCMIRLIEDEQIRIHQLDIGKERVRHFLPSIFISQYITLLQELTKRSGRFKVPAA